MDGRKPANDIKGRVVTIQPPDQFSYQCFLTPANSYRFLTGDARPQSLLSVGVEADVFGHGIRLDLTCRFHVLNIRERDARAADQAARYRAAATGAHVQIRPANGGAVIDYTPSMELPSRYRQSEHRIQRNTFMFKPGRPNTPAHPRDGEQAYVREAGESVPLRSNFNGARWLDVRFDRPVLTWRLATGDADIEPSSDRERAEGAAPGLLTARNSEPISGNLTLFAIMQWPRGRYRSGAIRFVPDGFQFYDRDGHPLSILKSALMLHTLDRDGIAIHARRGIEMHFEVRGP